MKSDRNVFYARKSFVNKKEKRNEIDSFTVLDIYLRLSLAGILWCIELLFDSIQRNRCNCFFCSIYVYLIYNLFPSFVCLKN